MPPKGSIKSKPDSVGDLDKIAIRLLRAADVGDQLPTPQDDIIECAKLVKGGVIDLDDFKESFLKKLGRVFFAGWRKVKGTLAVRDRTIYISADVPESQMPFLVFHEVSHNVIPWQKDAYDLFADDYNCLQPSIEAEFDEEANYVSAQLLFQCGRLQKEAMDFRFGIATGIKFAQDYGASYHSTLWHYVETNKIECTLLILKKAKYAVLINGNMELPYLLLYSVPSPTFLQEFGDLKWPKHFPDNHPFTAVVNDPDANEIEEGEFKIKNRNDEMVDISYETWTNTYNVFVLIWKKRQLIMPRKHIILTS